MFSNRIYYGDGKLIFFRSHCLQCHMMLQRSFLYSDLMLNKRIIIVKNIIFSQDCLMNREFKMTAVYCILAESFKFFQIYIL